MKFNCLSLLALLLITTLALAEVVGDIKLNVYFRSQLASIVKDAGDRSVVEGKDGWLYLTNELRHVSVGEFWGDAALNVSKAPRDDRKDPAPAIIDFAKQCRNAGIELIFVPIPPKAVIYPEHIVPDAVYPAGQRLDVPHRTFYDLLEKKGVNVLDLTPLMLKARGEKDAAPLYCKTDSHFSPRACALIASALAERIRKQDWYEFVDKQKPRLTSKTDTREIDGDLRQMLDDDSVPKEKLTFRTVYDGDKIVKPDRKSPVLLVGDSHNLVFHIGEDMHAEGAGLADQLALELDFPVDVVGVRGSGATPSRIQLYRRKDNLAGKKVVIWCLTAREFTESTGWMKIPIIK